MNLPSSPPFVFEDDGRGLPLVCSNATEQQVSDLRGGFCHVLALVLHERHGWRLRALGAPADEYSSNPFKGLGSARHVYCLRDDGLPVDVNGLFRLRGGDLPLLRPPAPPRRATQVSGPDRR